MAMDRPAGMRILEFFTETPLGEEILEGGGGGLMAGLSQVGSDKSPGQIALETAAAMLGGVAVGKAGRHIGAWAGKRMHDRALKDQGGTLAFIGRTFGNETTGKGLKENAIMGREAIKEAIVKKTSSQMAMEAMEDPGAFLGKYGVDPKLFLSQVETVGSGRQVAAALNALEQMPPAQREALLKQAREGMGGYEAVENLIARQAHQGFDATIREAAENSEKIGREFAGEFNKMAGEGAPAGVGDFLGEKISKALTGMDRPVQEVTGEHVGKAVGRFIGDEVGVLGGMATGSLLAQQLGMESPKDRKIRELEQQLRGR